MTELYKSRKCSNPACVGSPLRPSPSNDLYVKAIVPMPGGFRSMFVDLVELHIGPYSPGVSCVGVFCENCAKIAMALPYD